MFTSEITPYLCYREPDIAADWLCRAFGLSLENAVRDVDGRVIYISLRAGESRILVGPTSGTRFDGLVTQPQDNGGKGTTICYLSVSDVSEHRQSAAAAGAQIELEPVHNDSGQQYYLCRDIEGHLWSFGSQVFGTNALDVSQRNRPAPVRPQVHSS